MFQKPNFSDNQITNSLDVWMREVILYLHVNTI